MAKNATTPSGDAPEGLKPQVEVEKERAIEVLEAMLRYVRAGVTVPREWRYELASKLCFIDKLRS